MAITDLTNTSWYIKDTNCAAGYGRFGINFTVAGSSYRELMIGYYSDSVTEERANTIAIDYNGTTLSAGSILAITGGTDATNAELIAWLQENAIQVPADLTGTKWVFNGEVLTPATNEDYSISFSNGSADYTLFRIGKTDGKNAVFFDIIIAYYGAAWSDEGNRIIEITGGTDAINATLIAWLMANATQVPVVDLTDTEWVINNSPDETNLGGPYSINLISNQQTFDEFRFRSNQDALAYYSNGNPTNIYVQGDWVDNAYKTLTITGGTDVSNPNLLVWLAKNAEQQVEPEPTAVKNILFGTLNIDKIAFGQLDVEKIYLGDTLVWQAGSEPEPPVASYEIGFRGMSNSTPALTRTGEAVGATWAATSGVISIDGIDLTKIFGGYVGNDGEELTWDSATSKYLHNGTPYMGNVFVKINRFFAKAHYENNVLDGYDLCFAPSAPDNTYQDWFLGKDHCIIGCYKARGGGFSNGLPSKQGLSYTSSTSANSIVTAYKLNSSTAYSLHEKWYNENAILQVLFMAIFATKQTTDVFPQDTFRHRTNDTRATGYMDSYRSQSLFAYEPTGSSGMRGNMFLGIEDFVGWGYELVAGVVLSNENIHTSLDYANFVYSGSYADSGLDRPTTSGFIKELQQSDTIAGLLVPKVASGASAATYFCDYNSYGAGTMVWYQGANNPDANNGLFCFRGNIIADTSYSNYAARLCGTPQ